MMPAVSQSVADQLLYMSAIEMCKLGAVDEQLGNFEQCVRQYSEAYEYVLLHGLCQQALGAHDQAQLNKYKAKVERRLKLLEGCGIVHSVSVS